MRNGCKMGGLIGTNQHGQKAYSRGKNQNGYLAISGEYLQTEGFAGHVAFIRLSPGNSKAVIIFLETGQKEAVWT